MKKTAFIVLGLLLLGTALLYFQTAPTTYRIRMVVDVVTPDGPRQGSGVFRASVAKNPTLSPDEADWSIGLRGEAVPIDLPGGETVYALLRPAEDPSTRELLSLINAALDPEFRGGPEGHYETAVRLSAPGAIGRSVILPTGAYPLFVTFENPADPRTVRTVDAGNLGIRRSGNRIVRISLIVTDEPITSSLEERLPWLICLGRNLDGSSARFNNTGPNSLDRTDFIR